LPGAAADCARHPNEFLRRSSSRSPLVVLRRLGSATDAIPLPEPKPRAVCQQLVVPSIRSGEIAWGRRSCVRCCEQPLQRLDLGNCLFNVHQPTSIAKHDLTASQSNRPSYIAMPKEKKSENPQGVLKGWQQISAFLGQPVSVAQRWATEGMPVRKQGR
jgi:hypothetical protein